MTDVATRQGPLSGLRVLDLSRVLAGPWATQTLADLGAEVIKIERPGQGDDTRAWGPPYARDATGKPTAESAYFLAANRGKKSVTVDLSSAAGAQLIRDLANQSDVLVENFKAGGLEKYGLDYPTLSAINPKLIYCSITGFGQDGPYRDRAGYDFMIQGLGGLMSISGQPDGTPGAGPMKTGVAVADLMSGLYATIGILAALNQRQVTGRGQHIDIALLDCQVAMLANQAMNFLVGGTAPGRLGNAHPNIVPYEAFATADGHVILAVGNDAQFAQFARLAGHPEWIEDQRFAANRARVEHRAVLVPLIAAAMRQRTSADWLSALAAAGIPAGPINTVDHVFADPQVQARGLQLSLPHATAGHVPSVANPIRYCGAPLPVASAPPTLGHRTASVLADVLGLAAPAIDALRQQGVVE